MKVERSAGVIVFKKDVKLYFLLLRHSLGHWDFPKGQLEKGESGEQAALREALEEANLSNLKIIRGWKETIKYFYVWEGERRLKYVAFFLAETKQKDIKVSEEHEEARWVTYDEAIKLIKFKNSKEMLKKANEYI